MKNQVFIKMELKFEKTLPVSLVTHKKVSQIKLDFGHKTLDDSVELLLKKAQELDELTKILKENAELLPKKLKTRLKRIKTR